MSANKLYMIKNPSTVLNNNIPTATENTQLYVDRGNYRVGVKLLNNEPISINLSKMYSDEIRFSVTRFKNNIIIPTICQELNISESTYMNSDYTLKSISNIEKIIADLKNNNVNINFPRLNIS